MIKNSSVKTTGKKKVSFTIKSIRGKLSLLGLVSIVTTICLGFTGIISINSYNSSNALLSDINSIQLLQNENETLNIDYLYNLDSTTNDTIVSNYESMKTLIADAQKHSSLSNSDDINSLTADISSNSDSMTKLASELSERGFSSDTGLYASFTEGDEQLSSDFVALEAADPAWVDGTWSDISASSLQSVSIDGKQYKHVRVSSPITKDTKRAYVVIRVGGNGLVFSGNILISNISFDSDVVDLSGLTTDSLSNSYGTAYKSLSITDFNKTKAINIESVFTGADGGWEEASVEVPISDYNSQTHSKVSYDLYFPESCAITFRSATAFAEKFDFASALSTLNTDFVSYSKTVAEGTDASDKAKELQSQISNISDNITAYSTDKDLTADLSSLITAKSDAFTKISDYDTKITSLKSTMNSTNTSMSELINSLQTDIDASAQNTGNFSRTIIVIVFIAGILSVILITLYVISSINKSITGFDNTLKKISGGDMTVKAGTNSGDEFDQFGKSLNNMTDKISTILKSINTAATDINSSGSELQNASRITGETSENISSSINDIVQGANDQAKDVEESTVQMNTLGSLMDSIVTNVDELDSTSGNISSAGKDADSILQKLTESNHLMTDGVSSISEQISKTNQSVKDINDATSLISSIASQTNLLSLNASIEAARAGDAGKGFAVVASEISKLADQSAQSASSISSIIENLTSDFKITMDIMANVQSSTNEQNDNLSETQRKFAIVSEGIIKSQNESRSIKESIEACNEARVKVSEIILNLSAISEENAASTTETGEAMKKLNSTIVTLQASSQKLADISGEMKEQMKYFTV